MNKNPPLVEAKVSQPGEDFLTESSKSLASIAQSNKPWVGTCLYQEWCKPLLISCEAAFGYEQVAKRIANIRLTMKCERERMEINHTLYLYSLPLRSNPCQQEFMKAAVHLSHA